MTAAANGNWYMVNKMGMATLCASKADAEKEAADAQSVWPHMGPHRAVQLVEVADVEAMRAGYAAARLEIEGLRDRVQELGAMLREGRYYHLPIDAAEHSYTEPSPMAKVAAALRQKAEQEDAAYQARRSDQGLMESEWGPMEDAPPHEDPPMHVAVVEGDDTVRTLQWNRDVAAFAYPAGTLLYAARSQAKEGANHE